MHIAFIGSSLVSAFWNGAATYYRGILGALARRGHRITFLEPDAYGRQQHRDIDPPDWARVVVWENSPAGMARALEIARAADVVVQASGVGVFESELEHAVLTLKDDSTAVVFWDVDAPATLAAIHGDDANRLGALIPKYDMVLTYGGGEPVVQAYKALGAKACVPIYNALDPTTHYPVPAEARFTCDLAFLGNRLPDREARVEEFFLRAASLCPDYRFLLGGSGWDDKPMPANVDYRGHIYTTQHNALNCSARAVLNVTRDSMVANGFSPATRVLEVAGAGACLITDAWEGIEVFLTPDREVLVARDGEDVARHLRDLTASRSAAIAEAARRRMLAEHTYDHRAGLVERLLDGFGAAAGPTREAV